MKVLIRKLMERANKFFNIMVKIIYYIIRKTKIQFIPDKVFLKILYKYRMGKKLDLKNPVTMNEKLQWLKIYDRNPRYIEMVDKFQVRKLIINYLGNKYLIPLLGVWNRFEEINFDKLPDSFVLKTTHDSGSVLICKMKSDFNITLARDKIKKSLKSNYYYIGGEWPYKKIKPRIIAEEYITDTPESDMLTDYKFYCFEGKADVVLLCIDRDKGKPKFYFFDRNWNLKRYNISGKNAPEGFTLPKPEFIDQMFEIAEKLSKGIPFVRIDLYFSCGRIFFGEFTFYPSSGMDKNRLPEADLMFGELIKLPQKNNTKESRR